MEQDVQLHGGLSRKVLRHGLLPRLRKLARRFADRPLKSYPPVQYSGVQATQAVVQTRNSSAQAVCDAKTQGTQYEFVSVTRSTQTEEQCQIEDTSPDDLLEKIVCLVQRYLGNKSADVEVEVRQFLRMMERTYKESPTGSVSESHACNGSENVVHAGQQTQESITSSDSPRPKVQAPQHVATTVLSLRMPQSDVGLIPIPKRK